MSLPGGKSRGKPIPFSGAGTVAFPKFNDTGCFQCSKRRIICDNTQPTCKKCQKKGIECSGAARIRFSNAVALRGRLKGCTVPVVGESDLGIGQQPRQETPITPQTIRWKDDQKVRTKRKYVKCRAKPIASDLDKSPTVTHSEAPDGLETAEHLNITFLPPQGVPATSTRVLTGLKRASHSEQSTGSTRYGSGNSFGEIIRGSDNRGMISNTSRSISPWIAPFGSGIRMLFSHCKPLHLVL